MLHLIKKMNKTYIFLFIVLFTSCSKKWEYVRNPVIVKYKGKESILYRELWDKYSGYHAELFGTSLCVIFENNMANENIRILNPTAGNIFNFKITSESKNNVSKLLYLPNAGDRYNISFNTNSYLVYEGMCRKYSFLIIKKVNDKYILTYTNKINYKLTKEDLKTSPNNYPNYEKVFGN